MVATGSLLAASRELHMTQPALTKAVQELEEHMEQALFVRTRRGVELTDFGRMMHGHCRSLLAGVRLLADDLNARKAGVSGQVIVGSLLVASARLLPKALVLRALAPDVVVEVRVGGNEAMFEALVRGELDVMVACCRRSRAIRRWSTCRSSRRSCVRWWGATIRSPAGGAGAGAARALRLDPADTGVRRDAGGIALLRGVGHEAAGAGDRVGFDLTNLGLLIQSEMIGVMPFLGGPAVRPGWLAERAAAGPWQRLRHHRLYPVGREPSPAAERLLQALREAAEP